jgi:hypothetical protein
MQGASVAHSGEGMKPSAQWQGSGTVVILSRLFVILYAVSDDYQHICASNLLVVEVPEPSSASRRNHGGG